MTKVSPSSKLLKIGTRGSPLALVQARQVASALEALSAGALATELVTFTTTGDQLTTERLINSGGKGLFTKELDIALDDGRIDLAVHSLKDVPVDLPPGQMFAAFPTREDPREAFMSSLCGHPRDLPEGATVGTASLRREAQTLALRPDLKIKTFRGSVQTRMRKLSEGLADATYLAMAGLNRLNLANEGTPIPLEDMLPAACQGIIGVVTRKAGVPRMARDALARLDDPDARAAATAERAFLAALDGSCRTPIAAHLFREADCWRLKGEVLSTDGAQVWRAQETCPSGANDAALADLGRSVAGNIREAAGDDLPAFVDE